MYRQIADNGTGRDGTRDGTAPGRRRDGWRNADNVRERDGEEDDCWLNDIDYCMAVCKSQFPTISVMQSCLSVCSRRAEPKQGPGVQIVNTDPFGKGQHWILVSTLHCDDGVIDIYDSAQGSYLRSSVVECLAKYIPTKTGDSLTFRFILCDNGPPRDVMSDDQSP